MEQVLVLLLVSSSLGLNYNTNNCADISTYSDVAYNMSISQVCHYTTERRCEPRTKRLCINTPLTQCHIQTFTNCRSIPTIDTYRHDKTKTETFVPKKCQQSGVRIFEEIKNEAVCKTEVKRVCDRVFDTDSVTGRQIQVSGGENCQDKEYENCELQPVVIKTEVPQYECFDDTPITYVLPVFWNSLSQLIKRNVSQKLCQFVSQLRRIRVKLWSGKNVMKLSTHNVMIY